MRHLEARENLEHFKFVSKKIQVRGVSHINFISSHKVYNKCMIKMHEP